MRIVETALREIRVPLVSPWRTPAGDLKYRRSLILRTETDTGIIGYGEIAPLAGFSDESWEKALSQAELLSLRVSDFILPDTPQESREYLTRECEGRSVVPSVRFGFETAIADAVSQINKVPLSHWLGGRRHSVIPVNAVIGANVTDIEGTVQRIIDSGYRNIKLKVSAETAVRDAERVLRIKSLLSPDCVIRLDANRSFTLDEATQFIDEIGAEKIEYIEEPLASEHVEGLEKLSSRTGVSIAADESLSDPKLRDELLSSTFIAVVILKPTLLGGLIKCCDTADRARRNGKRVVVTSSIETGVGVAACAHLAAAVTDGITACGLDTSDMLEHRCTSPDLCVENGVMKIPGPGLGVTPSWRETSSDL